MAKRIKNFGVNLQAFTSVILAAVLLGFVAHESFHILTISEPTSLTVHFGAGDFSVETCCLAPGQSAMEGAAYTIQIVTTLLWVWMNKDFIPQN